MTGLSICRQSSENGYVSDLAASHRLCDINIWLDYQSNGAHLTWWQHYNITGGQNSILLYGCGRAMAMAWIKWTMCPLLSCGTDVDKRNSLDSMILAISKWPFLYIYLYLYMHISSTPPQRYRTELRGPDGGTQFHIIITSYPVVGWWSHVGSHLRHL